MLDQLDKVQYFTNLDLAAGYLEVRINDASRKKIALVTQQRLFGFRVMPFGLTCRILEANGAINGLNPLERPNFVSLSIC